MNCVSHIVDIISYEFGATEVDALYSDLDKGKPHYNKPPRPTDPEYEYCCNTFYERTVIFAGVYYIISIEHPELTEVLSTVYKAASYEEGQPYINHFIFELRKKLTGKENGTQHIDDFIPPHIIPDVHALMGGYRQLTPQKRLREFRKIELAIQSLPQGSRTIEIDTLDFTIKCAIRFLKRTFSIEEDAFIPENEKVTLSTLLDEYKSIASSDENGVIAAFLERVISAKEPSAQDPLYLEVLRKYQALSTTSHQSEVTEDVAPVAAPQPTEESIGETTEADDNQSITDVPDVVDEESLKLERRDQALALILSCDGYLKEGADNIVTEAFKELCKNKPIQLDTFLAAQSFRTTVCRMIGAVKDLNLLTTTVNKQIASHIAKKYNFENVDTIASYIGKTKDTSQDELLKSWKKYLKENSL
jgi:hypothetical protein